MLRGTKPLMVPLRTEDRGIKTDPQFSPYLRGDRYVVFFDYGHPAELGCNGFRTKAAADAWIAGERSKHVPGGDGVDVLGRFFCCNGHKHWSPLNGYDLGPCLAAINFSQTKAPTAP